MAKRNQDVCIKVNKNFFDRIFEPERRRLSNKFGLNISHSKFTSYLANSNAKLSYPKINPSPFFNKRRNTFRFSL
jgi:hypothetical protein